MLDYHNPLKLDDRMELYNRVLIQFIYLKQHCEIKRKYFNQRVYSE